jgi:hypothetical protein
MRGKFLAIVFILFGPLVAFAEPTRDEVVSAVERCGGIPDNHTWLDCFYGSAQPMRTLLDLPPAPATQTRLVPPPGAVYPRLITSAGVTRNPPREETSGFWADMLGSGKPAVADMRMASYRFSANGTFSVTLENGQIYTQDETDTVLAKWTRPATSYRVTIKASADKFLLQIKGEPGATFHVRRR